MIIFNREKSNILKFGPEPRDFNPERKEELLKMLSPNSAVRVSSILGNDEAYDFATRVKEFLASKNFTIDGVYQAVYSQPIHGQIVESPENTGDPFNIIIGRQL